MALLNINAIPVDNTANQSRRDSKRKTTQPKVKDLKELS